MRNLFGILVCRTENETREHHYIKLEGEAASHFSEEKIMITSFDKIEYDICFWEL
jgi:hypothetical protein